MSTERGDAAAFLKEWANCSTSPHFAVLIEGPWGCGKTHFVKSLVEDDSFINRKKIYLSLFGISDSNSFQTQLFLASASSMAKNIHAGAGLVGSVIKGVLRIDLNEDQNLDANANLSFSGAEKWIEKISKNLDNAVLILDDLERCPMPASNLLGIINPFLEHGDARVLIVANTEKIADEKFKAVREKVVGQSFKLAADFESAFLSFVAGVSNANVREVIKGAASKIFELYHKGEYQNLRQLRQFIWHLAALLEKFEENYLKNEALVGATIEQYWIMLIEVKTGANGISFDDILGRNDPAAELMHGTSGTSEAHERRQISPPLFDDDTANPVRVLLQKYNYEGGIASVISVQQWVTISETGLVDTERLNRELASAQEVQDKSSWPSWKRLWHYYQWDFSNGDAEFQADVDDVKNRLADGQYNNAGEFLHAAGIRMMLARENMIPDSVSTVCTAMKHYVDTFLKPHFSLDLYHSEKRRDLQSHDGLGFMLNESAEFKEIYQYFETKLDAWYANWLSSQAGPELLQQMKDNYIQFLGNLTYVRGIPTEQRFTDKPILASIAHADFVCAWLSIPRENEADVIGSLRDRYKHQPQLLQYELEWWERVRDELFNRAQTESMKPRSVQIRWLAEQVEQRIVILGKGVASNANL